VTVDTDHPVVVDVEEALGPLVLLVPAAEPLVPAAEPVDIAYKPCTRTAIRSSYESSKVQVLM
jgi:hypothetical protein